MKTLLLYGTLALWALASFARETIEIPLTDAPQIVDGNLDDPCWQKAYKTGTFRPLDEGNVLTQPTEAMFCRDKANLYIAFVCKAGSDEEMRKAISKARPGAAYGIDHVEIFLDPGDAGAMTQIGIDISGQISFPNAFKPAKYGVQYRADAWLCEIRIPYDAIKLNADSFSPEWAFNVARGNNGKKELATWSKLERGSFHDADAFNRVKMPDVDLKAVRAAQVAADKSDFEITTDRIVYTDQKEMSVKLDVAWRKSMKGFAVKAKLVGRDSAPVVERVISPVYFTTEFKLPLADVKDGRYRIDLALCGKDGQVLKSGSMDVWKVAPVDLSKRKTMWEIRNHVIYRNGKPHFPVFIQWCGYNETTLRDLQDHGFNLVLCPAAAYVDEDYERIKKLGKLPPWNVKKFQEWQKEGRTFAEMATLFGKHGIDMMGWPPYLHGFSTAETDALVAYMLRLRDIDNIAFWHTADETDGDVKGNALRNRLCHEIDPSRLTFLNTINGVVANKDNADIQASDPYPFVYGRSANISMVSANVDRLLKTVTNPKQSHFLWIQIFGDGTPGKGYRPATPAEARAEAFLAVNHGAKGFGWWCYQPPERRIEGWQDPKTWEELAKVHAEIQSLAEVYLLGEVLTRGLQGPLDVSAYRHGGKTYVSIVNTKDEPVKDCVVKVPGFAEKAYSFGPYGQKIEVR